MNAENEAKPAPVTVIYDPEAVLDLDQVKGKDERKALFAKRDFDRKVRLAAERATQYER